MKSSRCIILGLLIGFAIVSTPARADVPDTPAGKALAGLVDAINSANLQTIESFVKEHFAPFWLEGGATPRFYADAYVRRAQESGRKLTIERILHNEPAKIAAVVACANGKFLQFGIQVEPDPPHRIMMINMTPTDARPDAGPARDDAEVVDRLTSFIDTLAKADQFSGSVLVSRKGKTLLSISRGMADKGSKTPNRPDTKFNLASMNKMFTAIAIAQLQEHGKLAFDDPIGKFLPDYPNAKARSEVTIHMLLTHTSGLGGDIFPPPGSPARTIDQVIEQFANEPMRFEPGSQFAYCNAGFVVLGKIIERASGMDYYDYIRQNIYKPAGMASSDCFASDAPVANLAVGYTRMRDDDSTTQPVGHDGWNDNLRLHPVRGGPAGGGYSAVEDLQRFADALIGGKLLKPESLARVTGGVVDMTDSVGGRTRYGYGSMERHERGGRVAFGHEGTFYGVSTALYVYPKDGYVIAVLSNYDGGAPPIVRRFATLLP